MRRMNFLKTVLLAIILITSYTFVNAQADSLRAYYDGTSIDPVEDLASGNFDLVDAAELLATGDVALAGGSSIEIPSGSYTRHKNSWLHISDKFTVSMFIKLKTAEKQGLFSYQGNFGLGTKIVDDTLHFVYNFDGTEFVISNTEVLADVWYYVAMVHDGTNAKFYINGVEEFSQAITFAGVEDKAIAFGYDYVGATHGTKGFYFDETKIFNTSLTADQIAGESLLAYAGVNQFGALNTEIILDGSNSIGPDTKTFAWKKLISGVPVGDVLSTNDSLVTDTLSSGVHEFELTVSFGDFKSVDQVSTTIGNIAAVAGDDQTINEGDEVILGGSAVSVNPITSWKWELNGVGIGITDTIMTDTLSIGTHTFTLTVSDGTDVASDDVVVEVSAITVVADAGKNQAIVEGYNVKLDASASEGFDLSYAWRLNETDIGNTAAISTDTLSLGKHVFALKVTDAHGASDVDTVYIDVEGTEAMVDFETMASDTSFLDLKNGKKYLVFDVSNGPDKTHGDRLPDTGAVPTLVEGIIGQAMSFDGTKDWVNLQYAYTPGGFNAKSKDYSTSVWFNADRTSTNPPRNPSIVIFDSPGFGLMLKNDTLWATAAFKDRDKILPYDAKAIRVPFTAVNEWTNVVMVFEGASISADSSSFKLYINGKLIATETLAVPSFYADWYDWANVGATTGWASIASNDPGFTYLQEGDMGAYFKGKVDELTITRKALTDEEILEAYEEVIPKAPSNTAVDFETMVTGSDTSFFDFGNLEGVEIPLNYVFDVPSPDKNSNGYRVPVNGAVPELADGILGQAMVFDGSSDWVLLQHPYAYANNEDVTYYAEESEDFSTSIWFNSAATHTNPPKSADQLIFDFPGMGLNLWNDTLIATVGVRDRADASRSRVGDSIRIPFTTVDEWTNVVLVFDGKVEGNDTLSTLKVYLNGVLVRESDVIKAATLYPDEYGAAIVGAHYKWSTMDIYGEAEYNAEGDVKGYFKGMIDELTTTQTALTDAEILAAYEALVPVSYQLDITIVGSGSVSHESGMYSGNVELTATPDSGYQFDGWSGDIISKDNPVTITMDAAKSVTATFSKIIGVSDKVDNTISVYPNPTSGTVYINLNDMQGAATIQVMNSLGAIVKTHVSTSSIEALNLNDLRNGLYIIRVKVGDSIKISRIQLNK